MDFRPLGDMLLVKPDAIDDKVGSIHIPQGILESGEKPGDYREGFVGTVVAIGPGDDMLILRCQACRRARFSIVRSKFGRTRALYRSPSPCECGSKEYDIVNQGFAPMETKVGDRVIFPRRPNSPGGEFSVELEGEKYIMLHEEQMALGVLEAS